MVSGRRTRPAALLLDAMVTNVFVLDLFGKWKVMKDSAKRRGEDRFWQARAKTKVLAARSKKRKQHGEGT